MELNNEIAREASNRIMQAARLNTEVEAMKAENQQREAEGKAPAYTEEHFYELLNSYNHYDS